MVVFKCSSGLACALSVQLSVCVARLVLGFTRQGVPSKLPPPLAQAGTGDCWMLVGTEGNSDDGHRHGRT